MAKRKGTRKQPTTRNVVAPNVRKMAQATKAAKRKREDFSQAAARIVREATEKD